MIKNTPFTKEQVESLPLGRTLSVAYLGVDEKGMPVFAPNRKTRRAANKLKKHNNRKQKNKRGVTSRQIIIQHIQSLKKSIFHKKPIKSIFDEMPKF